MFRLRTRHAAWRDRSLLDTSAIWSVNPILPLPLKVARGIREMLFLTSYLQGGIDFCNLPFRLLNHRSSSKNADHRGSSVSIVPKRDWIFFQIGHLSLSTL